MLAVVGASVAVAAVGVEALGAVADVQAAVAA